MFPEYAKKGETTNEAVKSVVSLPGATSPQRYVMNPQQVPPPPSTKEQPPGIPTAKAEAPQPPTGVAYKERLSFVGCPHCGAQAPFELKEDSEITLIRFEGSAVPKKEAVAPEGSYRRLCNCVNPSCGEEFWLWASLVDGELKAEAKRKDEEGGWFSLPRQNTLVGSVSWSAEKQSWVVNDRATGAQYVYGNDGNFVEA
jgi:hypothetical protein